MPNNEDEWISDLFHEMQSVGWHHGFNALWAEQIKAKLLEARLDEIKTIDAMLITKSSVPEYKISLNDGISAWLQHRLAQLRASAPTKKEEDHE